LPSGNTEGFLAQWGMSVTRKSTDCVLDELADKIKTIYELLKPIHNIDGKSEDRRVEDNTVEWLGDPTAVKSVDHWLITCICYGPWREPRQKEVWQRAGSRFEEDFGGDVRNITEGNVNDLGFPLKWQRDWLVSLSSHLRSRGMSLRGLVEGLPEDGLEASDELLRALRIRGRRSKVIGIFVRDCLKRDVFPIDTRVRFLLSALVLPREERALVRLCQKAQVGATTLNRMFYSHQGKLCQKRRSSDCPLTSLCYRYALWSSCAEA